MTGSIPIASGGMMVSMSAPAHHNSSKNVGALFPSPSDVAMSAPKSMIFSYEADAPELPRRHVVQVEEEEEVSRVMNSESRYGSLQQSSDHNHNGGTTIVASGDPFALRDWVTLDNHDAPQAGPDDNLADFAFDFDQ